MSKRDQGASLTTYGEEGFVPEAVVNYLCLLGWSPKQNREILPTKEVIQFFDLPQILRHNARFDATKLQWLNGEYIRNMGFDRFLELAVGALQRAGLPVARFDGSYVRAALETCVGKIRQFSELAGYAGFYFSDEIGLDAESLTKNLGPEERSRLSRLRESFAKLEQFNAASLEGTLKEVAKALGAKAGALVHPCRFACTGKTSGPSLYHLLEVLGKDRVLQRIDRGIAMAG